MVARVVSSWSLHRTLGNSKGAGVGPNPTSVSLLDLPAALKEHGYDALQLCHFHIPDRSDAYLAQLRDAFETAGVDLDCLLIDAGDLVHPEEADEQEAFIGEWMTVGETLGATRARISAGRTAPTPDLLASSAERMVRLAENHPGIRLITENWLEMLPNADSVLELREHTGDKVGLMIDLGNWSGADKYDELARIAPFAESCHAKCHYTGTEPDQDDFVRSLNVLKAADFRGPMALIYDGESNDEWGNLDVEYEMVTAVFA